MQSLVCMKGAKISNLSVKLFSLAFQVVLVNAKQSIIKFPPTVELHLKAELLLKMGNERLNVYEVLLFRYIIRSPFFFSQMFFSVRSFFLKSK